MAKFNLDKWLKLVQVLAPVVLSQVPGGEKIGTLIPVIVTAIGEAEAIKGASGAEKKAHVQAVAAAGVEVANATGKVHLDGVQVAATLDKGIDTVVSAVNVVKDAHGPQA